jgi:hypothetical protein
MPLIGECWMSCRQTIRWNYEKSDATGTTAPAAPVGNLGLPLVIVGLGAFPPDFPWTALGNIFGTQIAVLRGMPLDSEFWPISRE